MHTDPALDHGWLRHCPGFALLARSAYNERLAEVYVRDALAVHPWRTDDPAQATIFYVPLWEVVSFNVADCNGTTHQERMSRAAVVLRQSKHFARRSGLVHADPRVTRHPGFNHLVVSSGCIEKGNRLEARLTRKLAGLLRASIVGRDRAYSSFYAASGVGRCTIEVPYVSNPFARIASSQRHRANATAPATAAGTYLDAAASATTASARGAGGRRKWLVSFMGSLDVCCPPGKEIRNAMRQLLALPHNESVQVLHFARAAGRPLPGRTPEEQTARYLAAGDQMRSSRFCLIPAGDNEVSSRLYSAMSAGCVPVVIANQLSGAFASRVPYSRFWLRVEQSAFIASPLALLARLRAIPQAEVAERRSRMLKYVPDVTYDQWPRAGRADDENHATAAQSTSQLAPSHPRAERLAPSRLVTNLLRAAESGCLLGTPTSATDIYPRWHKYASDDRWGVNCSCTASAPTFFWGPKQSGSHANRAKLWTRGRVPTEVCRCLHCATLCPLAEREGASHAPGKAVETAGRAAEGKASAAGNGVQPRHGQRVASKPKPAKATKPKASKAKAGSPVKGRLSKPRDMLAERERFLLSSNETEPWTERTSDDGDV